MGSESEGEMLLDVQIIVIRCHELNQRSRYVVVHLYCFMPLFLFFYLLCIC
jgi:hypothetical protein